MRFLSSVLVFVATVFWFASPALAGNWGENWGEMTWTSVAMVPGLEGIGVWLLVIFLMAAAAWRIRRQSMHASLVLVLLPIVPLLMAPHYTNWYGFANGGVADADQVNHNFIQAAAALDDFEVRVSALESQNAIPQAATQMFLTTDACPAGYNAVENGYIKLGATGLTTDASQRTLANPGHGHSHSLQSDQYPGHNNGTGFGPGVSRRDISTNDPANPMGAHSHTITGTIGSGPVSGDTPQAITGDLEHITLRLCVRQ